MGAAAYNRGTMVISMQIDAESRLVEFEMMDILNALPKYADAGRPFGPIQFVYDERGFWAAECPVTGFGYFPYRSLHEAVRRWKVDIVAFDSGIWMAEVRNAA